MDAGPPAWSLYPEIDRRIASMWLFVALILSILGGVAAGVSSDDANIGFNVGTCILAILSTVQGLLILWQT